MPQGESELNIEESVTSRIESVHLMTSNRKKCTDMLSMWILNKQISEDEIIDFFISLHLVLEASLNAFFRTIIIDNMKKSIPKYKVIDNLDGITFIDKVIMYIYYSEFNFVDNDVATKYHSVIGSIKHFSNVRNKLLHGSSISTIYVSEQETSHSTTKLLLTPAKVLEQIENFRFIMEAVTFYLDASITSFTDSGKNSLKLEYLDSSFLKEANSSFLNGSY